jgi:histidinol-phosphatase (PHP family)
MILADLHTHTQYSHGTSKTREMHAAAVAQGLELIGFTEHSPRPEGFDYKNEYRKKLLRHLPDYVREVQELKSAHAKGPCRVLFGMEMDWLEGQEEHIRATCTAWDFDYLLGSVHFLGRWGFDESPAPWKTFSQEECEQHYTAYFTAWKEMISSGLFQIAAHPDLIKIFSVEQFHVWLAKAQSLELIGQGLEALRRQGMSMEISSAGLRKACHEIYPAVPIMRLAAELAVPISFASDAHRSADVGHAFPQLAAYAKDFGFREYVVFEKGQKSTYPLA